MIDAEIENFESFQKAMRTGEKVAARGLWHGTSRALGRYRRHFLENTPVGIGGKKSKKGIADPNRTSPIGRKFLFKVKPPTPPNARRFSSNHVRGVKEVAGDIGTQSEAAESLEKGPTIRRRGPGYLGIPIAIPGNPNSMKQKAGASKARAKPSWRNLGEVLRKKRNQYNFQFQKKGSRTIVWARHKKSEARPFPFMLLIKQVKMKKGQLKFFSLWPAFIRHPKGVLDAYDKEIQKQIDNFNRRIRQRRF